MKNRKMLVAVGVAALTLVVVGLLFGREKASPADAAPSPRQNEAAALLAGRGQGPVSTGFAAVAAPAVAAPLSSRGTKTVRVTSDRTMTEPLQRALTELGARVIAPVGPRAVLVEATPEISRKIARDSRFATEDVLPAAKVQNVLADMCAKRNAATVAITIVGLAAADRAALTEFVLAKGGALKDGPQVPETFYADVPADLVASLAERGDVRWLEYRPEMKLLNDCSVVKEAANVETVRSKHFLRGRGQVVSVYDSGFDTGDKDNCHLDFEGRVKAVVNEAYTKADYMGHGTHCAGTVLGDGARSGGQYQGAAPEATLFAQCAGDTSGSTAIYLPGTYEHIFASVCSYGGYIQSDSWGGGDFGVYDTMCQGLDQVLWNHPDLLVVVAAGNDGKKGLGTVSSPACAKNALTVGNGYSTRNGSPEDLNVSSSRGPTLDGRIKPEISAPGTYKYSTLSSESLSCKPISGNSYYTEMTGTSMATPLVAGSAALVRQWLIDRRDYTNERPTAALVKAILTGGGTMMKGSCSSENIPQTLPNNYTGWGRLNLEETLYPTNGYAVKFADRIPFHDGVTETIELTTTCAAPLDVQLCWTDYPADPSAAQTLINDLDLIVSNKTTGAVWYGNGVEGGDHTNTTESVRLSLAEPGDYAVLVRGYAIVKSSDGGKGAAAVYIRGAFPDETKEDPLYVRNVRTGENYEFLDEAIGGVAAGDTLQICHAVELRKTVAIPAGCTIVSTNDDPTATLVTRRDGAALTVAGGATLTLTNVAFSASGSTLVTVASGGNVMLEDGVTLGVDAAHVAISTADAGGFTLACPLESTILFHCDAATADPAVFGSYACELAVAEAAAGRIVCADDPNRETRGEAADGQLKWKVTAVPVEESAGYFVDGTGTTNAYARMDRVFERYLSRTAAGETFPEIVVRETLDPAMNAISRFVAVSSDLTLRGETSAATISLGAAEAGFSVPSGVALTLTNLTVSGAGVILADCAFKVTGGAMTLESGATLSGLADLDPNKNKAYGGTIAVTSGSVTMKSGSRIENCSTIAVGGGAIWVGSANSTANLLGGTITGCSASGGGAVCAYMKAKVNVGGDFVASDNTKTDGATLSNILLYNDTTFTLTDELTGLVGVSYVGGADPDRNEEGAEFITIDCELAPSALTNSAACFCHDVHTNLIGGCVEGQIVWVERPVDDGQCDPGEAGVRVTVEGESKPRWYLCIDDAFEYVKTNATFEVKGFVSGDTDVCDCLTKDVTIDHDVRITSWEGYTYNESDIMILWRTYHAMYKVAKGGSLTLSNVKIVGACSWDEDEEDPWDDEPWCSFTPLFYEDSDPENPVEEPSLGYGLITVDGGSLTLEDGARVGYVFGNTSRSSNAITVFNGGTVTMESGSRVMEVDNQYVDDYETSCGGGILLDRSTGYFRGGAIFCCKAYRAGGLYVANGSTAYVSGSIYIDDNESWKRLFDQGSNTDISDNVVVSKNSKLVLAGPLESASPWSDDPENPDPGFIGVNESLAGDTNWFGYVSEDWNWDYDTLINSAAYFRHDKRSEVFWAGTYICGTAVTNWNAKAQRWDARLVWEDSLSPAKGITIDGVTYRGAIPAGVTVAVPTAFSVTPVTGADGKMVLELDGGVEGCWYTVYSTENLAKPFTVETSVQLKTGETFEYEVDRTKGAKFYKVVAEEGLK